MIASTFLDGVSDRAQALINRVRLQSATLTEAQLNWSPGEGLWSIGQILDHLEISNGSYLPVVEHAVEFGKPGRNAEVRHSFIGAAIAKAAGPSGNAPVPKAMVPKNGPFDLAILDRFIAQHETLLSLARRSGDLDLTKTKLANPIVPIIKLNLADCFEIMVSHGERHVGQIEQLSRRSDFPQ